MLYRLQQLWELVMPQGSNPHLRVCSIQIICLVMTWFFVQASGSVAVGAGTDAGSLTPDDLAVIRLLNVGAQCGGGIVGSLLVLFDIKTPFMRGRVGTPEAPVFARRSALVFAAILAILLVACFVCTLAGLLVPAALLRLAACSIITLFFLRLCLLLASAPLRTVLGMFLLVALFRVVQSLLMLPLEPGVVWSAVSLVAELALLGGYVGMALRAPAGYAAAAAETMRPRESRLGLGVSADQTVLDAPKQSMPWQFIVHVMVFYFVVGVLRLWENGMVAPGLQSNGAYLVAAAAAFLLYYASFVRTGNTSDYWARIRQIAFPLLVAACSLSGMGFAGVLVIAVVLGQAGYRFFLLASYVEMFSICDITNMKAREVFSVTHLVMYVGMLGGAMMGMATQAQALGDPTAALGLTLFVFLLLTVASCWLGNDKRASKVWGRRIELTPKGRHEELLAETCQALADEYRLTAKEQEVLEHLVRKQSLHQIAEALVVSKNTVRTHVRNLYAKTGAHSQSDIYRLYDETRASLGVVSK